MATNLQQFDFSKAEALKTTLTKEASKIEVDLNQTLKKVQGVREWWKGGSEEGFIANFEATKNKIVKSLNDCISQYQTLIDEIKTIKQESEAQLESKLRGL